MRLTDRGKHLHPTGMRHRRGLPAIRVLQCRDHALAEEVKERRRDRTAIRVGLNSGQVSQVTSVRAWPGYTASVSRSGRQQRMESVDPPRGVMLSESCCQTSSRTARCRVSPRCSQDEGQGQPVALPNFGNHELDRGLVRRDRSRLVSAGQRDGRCEGVPHSVSGDEQVWAVAMNGQRVPAGHW